MIGIFRSSCRIFRSGDRIEILRANADADLGRQEVLRKRERLVVDVTQSPDRRSVPSVASSSCRRLLSTRRSPDIWADLDIGDAQFADAIL